MGQDLLLPHDSSCLQKAMAPVPAIEFRQRPSPPELDNRASRSMKLFDWDQVITFQSLLIATKLLAEVHVHVASVARPESQGNTRITQSQSMPRRASLLVLGWMTLKHPGWMPLFDWNLPPEPLMTIRSKDPETIRSVLQALPLAPVPNWQHAKPEACSRVVLL